MQAHAAVRSLEYPSVRPGTQFADRAYPPPRHSTLFQGMAAHLEKGSEIYGEGDEAQCVYRVLTGAVCTYKILVDGRRQIASFYLPGDSFGLEGERTQSFTAEAIAATTVVSMKRSYLLSVIEKDAHASAELTALAMEELFRAQRHLLMLSQTARARLAGFLLEMAERLKTGWELELPMGRRDIADYLGLTVETVSRTFARLEEACIIAAESSRRIALHDLERLKAFSD